MQENGLAKSVEDDCRVKDIPMHPLNCPECSADLDADTFDRTGQLKCPFCGKLVPTTQIDRPEGSGRGNDNRNETAVATVSDSPPSGSRIEIYEASAERLVIVVPPGGRESRGLLFFAILWNSFMVVFTAIWLSAGKLEAPILAFIGVFWLVGIGLLIGWIKLRFERSILVVEPSRVVVQHILFGRKRQTEAEPDVASRATLVEAYSQNEVPVYSVTVKGTDKTVRFGTSLSNDEKDWLADRINVLIAPSSLLQPVDAIDMTDETLLDPDEELPESIHIVADDVDQLSFWFLPVKFVMVRWFIVVFTVLFSLVFLGAASQFAFAFRDARGPVFFRIVPFLFVIPAFCGGVIPLAIGLFAWLGRVSVLMDRERISASWHVGIFGLKRTLPLADIASVSVVKQGNSKNKPRNVKNYEFGTCIVRSKNPKCFLFLTCLNDDRTVRHVTALVRRKWKSFVPAGETSE